MLNRLNNPFVAILALACFLFIGWASRLPEAGYNRSVFDVLPKAKPFRTSEPSEMLGLWQDYSKNNLNYDLPEDWK